MDILAHTLWTNAGARAGNKLAEKKGRKFRVSVGWTAFFGLIPDFFAFTVPFFIALYRVVFTEAKFSLSKDHHSPIGGFDIASYLYQFSHSLVIFALVFILVWVISKRPRFELLGWALHILIDIPSHAIGLYPTPFLFPISDYRFPYGVSWGDMWYMIVNYSALLFVWVNIIYKKKRVSRTFKNKKVF